jgi:hypothetical protein
MSAGNFVVGFINAFFAGCHDESSEKDRPF